MAPWEPGIRSKTSYAAGVLACPLPAWRGKAIIGPIDTCPVGMLAVRVGEQVGCVHRHLDAGPAIIIKGTGLVVQKLRTKKKSDLTVRPCKALKVMYVRGGPTCFGAFLGKKSYRDVR
jgi:hypothetical protein